MNAYLCTCISCSLGAPNVCLDLSADGPSATQTSFYTMKRNRNSAGTGHPLVLLATEVRKMHGNSYVSGVGGGAFPLCEGPAMHGCTHVLANRQRPVCEVWDCSAPYSS